MRGWWQDLTDLVLPAECGGCGRPLTVLCDRCRTALSGAAPRRVRPEPEPAGLPVTHAAARYADEVRAMLLAHKERGALALSRPLGEALAKAVSTGLRGAVRPGSGEPLGPGPLHGDRGTVLLVPMPSARRAVRARGHDPALRIARAAAGALRRQGVPASVLPALRQRRGVADQSGLDARERWANLAGALVVAPGCARLLREGQVVLVDDLMTTGASLAEAARAVRTALRAPDATDRAMVHARPAGTCAGARTTEAPAGAGTQGRAQVDLRADSSISASASVYRGETWERCGEQRNGSAHQRAGRRSGGSVGTADADRADWPIDVKCAAVVAASPDSFEMNRN
ncbi:ComF family protein [Streptomyces sp. KMM 9044]|uniref:ComF family protein n=1 Tax=Streptomyces sp. KMM 9044 TaxID=2744474 RepID=UPI00215172A5|nr:ComF family protein [Streptomyces sp. KMM 9044]WAX79721.1 ComF family protein [Streptomyces sp. KMM 9044]